MSRLPAMPLIACVFMAQAVAHAQEAEMKPVKLFKDHSALEVTLKGPWRRMARRPDSAEKYDGQMTYTDSNGETHTLDIGITTRGLTRKKVCDFPPLKLWFDKDQVKGTTFRGQKSLKMVTHCKVSKGVEQYYITEYLSYRVYNLITDYSFRVRPMMVTYEDSERKSKKQIERFGFLIEDIDDVAARHDLQELEIPKVSHRRLDPLESARYALFQYLISNLDWSVTGGRDPVECCHNSKLIAEGPDANPVFAIPYDLDSSGLVSADYAAPPDKLPVRSLKQRLYRGFCIHNDRLPEVLGEFRDKRQQILGLFESNQWLTSGGKRNAVQFLDGFYDSLAKPGDVQSKLIDKCRG